MKNKVETIKLGNTTLKISMPDITRRVGLLLHGFTGDESSMWVFTNRLGPNWLLIAPRGPYPSQGTDLGGFSWVDEPITSWPVYQDFLPAVSWLEEVVLEAKPRWFPDIDEIHLVGFSQGAAMSFVYANAHASRISKVSMLSGFLPDASEGFINGQAIKNIPFFIGHGEKDNIVPVEKAQHAYQTLSRNGVHVQLCLSDVGHKLGSTCFDAFTSFMEAG